MDSQQNLIAEFMTKLVERLDENNDQSPIVNFFLMSKDEQVAEFKSWLGQKTSDLAQDTIVIEAHYTQQVIEIEAKIQATEVITKGGKLPDPIVKEVPVLEEPVDAIIVEETVIEP